MISREVLSGTFHTLTVMLQWVTPVGVSRTSRRGVPRDGREGPEHSSGGKGGNRLSARGPWADASESLHLRGSGENKERLALRGHSGVLRAIDVSGKTRPEMA